MFKLTKILNSGVNVAEPCRLNADESLKYVVGSAAVIKNGKVTNASATEKPELIIVENEKSREGTVLCARIFPGMIFECPVSDSPVALRVGDAVTLDVKDGAAIGVTATTAGGVATVTELNGATNAGDTIFVRIV